MMMMLQLEMYQQQYQNQPQQQNTTVVQTTGAAQPVFYAVPPPVCELYDSGQSKIAGIILIIAGALSIIFNIIGMVMGEIMAYNGHGFWCGIMVSSCVIR